MMKNYLPRLTAALLCLCFLLPVTANAAGLSQFSQKNTYSSRQFTDISASAWYYGSV